MIVFIKIISLALALTSAIAQAQTYPQRPVRIVAPYPAGASYDTVTRVLGEGLAERMGQPMIVENRPGASGIIGAELVAKATPDGYTLGMLGDNHTILPAVGRKTSYDLFRDFTPIMRVASLENVVVIHPSVPATTLKDWIVLLKASPGKYRYGSGGTAGSSHLAAARFTQLAGVSMLHVPYKAGGIAVTGLLGNEVQSMVLNMISAKGHVLGGRMRALATAARERSPHLPNVPTAAEAGLPGLEVSQFYALMAPARTPTAVLARLDRDVRQVAQSDGYRKRLDAQGATPGAGGAQELEAFLRREIEQNRSTAQAAGITAEQ